MRAWIMGLAIVLAGCAGSEPGPTDDDDFEDVEADATTGGIRGVVVDQAITPIAGAVVTLELGDNPEETTTGEDGRFTFGKLAPGSYFLTAKKPLHETVQFSAEVEAGVAEPAILKVQLPRLFEGDPFMVPISHDGYFTCSQAGMPGYLYSSSPCHSFNVIDLDDYGYELPQERVFHSDVEPGWQTQVFEMTWESSLVGTSERMGMSVSTYHPERNKNHWFASVDSDNPMRFQLDVGEMHETAQEGSGPNGPLPPEGMIDMSYYMSVRAPEGAACPLWCVPPGLALEQSFTAYLHQFYYLPAPDSWSIIGGDENPF